MAIAKGHANSENKKKMGKIIFEFRQKQKQKN